METTMLTIEKLLAAPAFGLIARVVLTFIFWSSGIAKLLDFPGAVAEMERYGVTPAVSLAVAVVSVQLLGSALVITGRYAWLGAGALAIFTLLTIPIAHAFWNMNGDAAFVEMMFAFEHVTVIGGLMVAAVQAAHQTGGTRSAGRVV
jgi:transmembrane protein